MAERGQAKAELVLSGDERETLERWARRPKSLQALAPRSPPNGSLTSGKLSISLSIYSRVRGDMPEQNGRARPFDVVKRDESEYPGRA